MNQLELWNRYKRHYCSNEQIGLRLDISRMMFDETFLDQQAGPIARALDAMDQLEHGATAAQHYPSGSPVKKSCRITWAATESRRAFFFLRVSSAGSRSSSADRDDSRSS